jgi:hypothetical protein
VTGCVENTTSYQKKKLKVLIPMSLSGKNEKKENKLDKKKEENYKKKKN